MGGGKKSKAPKAPDYSALAQQQGEQDRQTAQYLTEANRVNQFSPYGQVQWSRDNTAAQRAYDEKMAQLTAQHNAAKASGDRGVEKSTYDAIHKMRAQGLDSVNAGWTQTTSLTPEEQAIFSADQANRLSMQGLAGRAIGSAGQVLGSQWNPQLSAFAGTPQNRLNSMSDLQEGSEAFKAQNEQVRDAMYQQLTRFNDERFGEEEARERSRLQQLGLQEGTQAYQNALQEFRRGKDEAYSGAQLQSILAGGQEQSRLFADQLSARQSNIGLRQGQYGQDMGIAQLLANQRQQQFGEQAYQRSLPLNEIAALLGTGGVQMPQFPGYSQATPFQGADLLGAAQAGYGAKMGAYNSGQQQKGSLLGAGASLAGGFLGGK